MCTLSDVVKISTNVHQIATLAGATGDFVKEWPPKIRAVLNSISVEQGVKIEELNLLEGDTPLGKFSTAKFTELKDWLRSQHPDLAGI